MKIKTLHISNYRKIIDSKINMENNITVIAGANNSGKTSLVELFNSVFGNVKGRLCCDDLPATECQKWSQNMYSRVNTIFSTKKEREDIISDIVELIEPFEKPENAMLIPPIEIKIQIDYDENEDDIRNFADYIMEFAPDNTSFYFIYRYVINTNTFKKSVDTAYEKLLARFNKLTGNADKDKDTVRIIREMLVQLYADSCEETAYFSDKSFMNIVPIDIPSFKALFNYHNIMAGRTLDDENSDRTKILSKNMIDIASREESWQELIQSLPDQIIQPIQDAHIQEIVRKASLETLSDTIDAVSKTNGGQAGNIIIDMNVTEEAVHSLLKNITCAKYQKDDYYLRESSQGLGYSNLIYIHLQLEKFKKTIDPLIVNFFVIEEPEAHMHPQMQNVFAQYLFDYYNHAKGVQGVLTTHSHEVVRIASISQLRVLRQETIFKCNIFDLREFQNSIATDKELLEFYDWFYNINFPDIIFADKIIMYEGDTERMLIKSLLQSKEFESLRNQYISFVQVGGAYAYNYRAIIEFLGIKSVLITDLDYIADSSTIADVLASGTTNSTINKFAESTLNNSSPTVQMLYDWKATSTPIVIDHICLAFQGICDGYSRTLEEAMLTKFYKVSALEEKAKDDWKEYRKKDKLKYTIPRDGDTCNVHSIVQHTSNGKTDFMYSVILNGLVEDMLPAYIKEALLWLIN
jgi:hypothetical protein